MRALAFGLAFCAVSSIAVAQPAPDPGTLFAEEADLFAPRGLVALELPAAVIAACRPDLSDLRVVDRQGRPIPYLVVRGTGGAHGAPGPARPAKVLDVAREIAPSDTDPKRVHERYELATPDTSAPQRLEIGVSREYDFVRGLDVSFLPVHGPSLALVRGASLFQLPHAQKSANLDLGVLGKGRVRIELTGQGSFLEPSFRWQNQPAPAKPLTIFIELHAIATRHEAGTTFVTFARPPGVAPSALLIGTRTALFDREVHVVDATPTHRLVELGAARIARGPDAERNAALLVPLKEAPKGDRLELEIHDRDSPPLEALRVRARVPQPTLVFDVADEPSTEPSARLRFGGGRARAPDYDLERNAIPNQNPERVLAALPSVRIGLPRTNSKFESAPPLRALFGAGAQLDTRAYAQVRSLKLPESREGLYRIALSPEDVALARSDLADVRIVDATRHQRAYLVERDATPIELAAQVALVSGDDPSSRYRIEVKRELRPVNAVALELTIATPAFDRSFHLLAHAEQVAQSLADGELVRKPGDPQAQLPIEFKRIEADDFELTVENRADAPLAISGATVRALMPELYVVADPGEYLLLLGNPDALAPSYDLERARELVLSVASRDAVLGPLRGNPAREMAGKLALLRTPGAPLDVSGFSHMRLLKIAGTRDGLTRVVLAPEDLAIARPDLGDVRVVDAEKRQRAYLVQPGAETKSIALAPPKPESREHRSHYRFELPEQPLPLRSLVLATDAAFFDRPYELSAKNADGKDVVLSIGRLSRRVGPEQKTLAISLPGGRLRSLELAVSDGEDAPLEFQKAEVTLALPALLLVAEPGRYQLLFGEASAAAPHYDLSEARELVFAAESSDAVIGKLGANPAFGARARIVGFANRELVLWLTLALAIVVMTALTFRLITRK